ncbi:hypothetical protein [Paraherbaspirillum soli]|uniref:N-acetyltransferase domain-containing protein n=1 Tax=Paraherbaspirillum soli TaxID=631222 RepID=A0ABW0M7G8_9BURK
MTILALSKERRARVWLDSSPPDIFTSASPTYFHRRIETPNMRVANHRIATVELFIPLGGRFLYGLLGCEINGVKASALDIAVQTSSKRERKFTESLAGNLDTVWSGIPDEYATAVLDGANAGISKFGAPTGETINFCFAAHGETGSTVSIFERLGMATVALLMLPEQRAVGIGETLEQILSR